MADSPQPGGWIKLWRSMKENGHLQMPDRAFKLFVYLLLQVNHKAAYGLQPGEGWITYQMIREECCEAGKPPWNKSTVSLALRFLKTHGYIECIKATKGLAQRIRILNWDKYQGDSGPETGPVTGPVTGPLTGQVGGPVAGQVTGPKQERIRKAKKVKKDSPPVRESPETPPNTQPEPPVEPKEADPESEATQTIAAALYELQKREGIDVTKFDFGAARRIAGSALKGGKGAAAINATEAVTTLHWGFNDKVWRQRFLSGGMVALKSAWAAWRETQGQPQRPQSNIFTAQQQAYEQARREEAASEEV